PEDACGAGFVSDGARGCRAVLPAAACAFGLLAVPGETACHEVAPCGAAPWGDIPVEATTQYVDGAFAGASDGSAQKPHKTIQAAISAAAAGAIVAVAAGSYPEDVTLAGKRVRLWGRCAKLVEIAGSASPAVASLLLREGSDGSEVHGVAVRGASYGVVASAAKNLALDRVW